MQLATQLSVVEYKDTEGRLFKVQVPNGVDPKFGVVIGPPFLDNLNLPHAIAVKLHNELYYRGLYTCNDIRNRRQDVMGAIQAAVKLTIEGVIESYECQQ